MVFWTKFVGTRGLWILETSQRSTSLAVESLVLSRSVASADFLGKLPGRGHLAVSLGALLLTTGIAWVLRRASRWEPAPRGTAGVAVLVALVFGVLATVQIGGFLREDWRRYSNGDNSIATANPYE